MNAWNTISVVSRPKKRKSLHIFTINILTTRSNYLGSCQTVRKCIIKSKKQELEIGSTCEKVE